MKRLIALGAVALALWTMSSGQLSVSASRMSRPDKQRLVYKRHHAGAHTRWDAEWSIAPPRGASIGIIVGAAVCGDEAFLLDRQRAAVHRADLHRGVIVEDLGLPQDGFPGLREVASLAADCAGRALYVVDHDGVTAIEMDSGRVSARFAKPASFVNSVAGTSLEAGAQVLSVSGLWPAAASDWLVKPVDRMFEADRLGYRLDLRTGQTAPLVAAV